MKGASDLLKARKERKLVGLQLRGYFQSLTSQLDQDAEAFFGRVMELSRERGLPAKPETAQK